MVFGELVVAGGDGAELLELAEDAGGDLIEGRRATLRAALTEGAIAYSTARRPD